VAANIAILVGCLALQGAKWHMDSGRYLVVGKNCKDCQMPVVQMVPKPPSTAMLFHCDRGIKGFDAPDDAPMKEELTCDLVLCPQYKGVW
jgi:hypothetical protein